MVSGKAYNADNLDADFVADGENWETTYSTDNLCGFEYDLFQLSKWNPTDFAPVEIARLKKLPSQYATRLPTKLDAEGKPTDFEVRLFDSLEDAQHHLDSFNSDENGLRW